MRHAHAICAILLVLGTPVAARGAEATGSMALEEAALSWLPPHEPWIAGGLSLALNGTGQFYNHERGKGWLMLAPVLAYPAAWALDAALGVGYFRAGDAVLVLGTKIWSVIDAYQEAERASVTP